MAAETLTAEQQAFLEECLLEFSDRYTDSSVEYKKVYDAGIPPPPIMYPWYGRPKLNAQRNRDRSRSNRYNDRNNYHQDSNYRDRDREYDRDQDRRYDNNYKYRDFRSKPY